MVQESPDAAWGARSLEPQLPPIGYDRPFAEAGGLLSYARKEGEDIPRIVVQVDKILKGSKPGDLPVGQPMRFAPVINLKTAQALGLALPPTLLFRADEVIK